jgi:surface antigen
LRLLLQTSMGGTILIVPRPQSVFGASILLAVTAAFPGLGAAMASGFAAPPPGALPRILSAPTTVRASAQVTILARVNHNALCHVILSSKGRVEARSVAKRAPAGEIFFSWSAPRSLHTGKHTATVKCRGITHLAKSVIHAVGTGSHSLARPITVTPLNGNEPAAVRKLGAVGYPSYGWVMVPGSGWFGGHGVNVYSNGAADNETPPADYYQCVELVERFLRVEGFGPAIPGNANQLYANAPSSSYDHHLNGSGYLPVPGDIVVFGGGAFGHVAIVDQVTPGAVGVVEQNASPTGRSTLTLHGSTIGGEYRMSVIGVLHAKADMTHPEPPSPASNSWQVAWNAGELWTTGADVKGSFGLGVAAGTSPSIATLTTGGWEAAFRASDGHLWVVGADDKGDMDLGVAPGTSPSIAALAGGGWEVAFHASGGGLWVVGKDDRGDMQLGMAAGTSPSITGLANGSWEAAWNAGSDLWVTGPTDVRGDMGVNVAAGTSPSIASLGNGSWEVAWNNGGLWVTGPTDVRGNMNLGISPGTNPNITGLTNGSWEAAWNADGLWITGPTDVRGNMHLGISAGTSPSIAGLANGSWEVAWNAAGVWITGPTDVRGNMNLGISAGTSPSIAGYP